jgi:nicotinamide riboside transporter PnuC
MGEYWSWLLAVLGVSGMYFVGKKTIWGWLVLLANEVIWVVYAFVTQQYGFILMAVAYAVVYIKSYLAWKKEDTHANL